MVVPINFLIAGKGSYGAAYLASVKADGSKVVLKEISLHGLSRRETETALLEGKVNCLVVAQNGNRQLTADMLVFCGNSEVIYVLCSFCWH